MVVRMVIMEKLNGIHTTLQIILNFQCSHLNSDILLQHFLSLKFKKIFIKSYYLLFFRKT